MNGRSATLRVMRTTALEGSTMNGLRIARRHVRRHAADFVRFVGLGSGVTLAASAVLVLLSQWMPWMAANVLTTVASGVAATELHARVSFGHGRPGLAGHMKSAATMGIGWLVTSAAVGALSVLRPGAGLVLQQSVYLSATALVGIGRYLVLRLSVFAERSPRPRPRARTGAGGAPRAVYDAAA
jgi:putative flippase GtrA